MLRVGRSKRTWEVAEEVHYGWKDDLEMGCFGNKGAIDILLHVRTEQNKKWHFHTVFNTDRSRLFNRRIIINGVVG